MKITFSIVTVCYNAVEKLRKTVLNSLEQTYESYEIIIVDGNSKDGTDKLLREWKQNEKIFIISEPDRGLYDAMNKGILASKGDFIIFMNAGDVFDNSQVLAEASERIELKKNIIYYGISKAVYPGGDIRSNRILLRKHKRFLYEIFDEKMPNHQAIIASRDCFQNNMFDERYRLCADFCWIARCVKYGIKIKEMNICVARFEVGGVSSRPSGKLRMQTERKKILTRNFPIKYRLYTFFHPR